MACSKCEARRRAIVSEVKNMDGFAKRFTDWIKRPYNDDMTVGGWFLFLGLMLLVTVVWTKILNKVLD